MPNFLTYIGPINTPTATIVALTVDPKTNRPIVAMDAPNNNFVYSMNSDNSWSQIPLIQAVDIAKGTDDTLAYVSTTPFRDSADNIIYIRFPD